MNFRLVTATHRSLRQQVEEGGFRADLFFRINVFPLEVPRLADRQSDIPLILEHLIELYQYANPDRDVPFFSVDALHMLMAYEWPGNVRELRNVLDRAAVMFAGKLVSKKDLKSLIETFGAFHPPQESTEEASHGQSLGELPEPEIFKGAFHQDTQVNLKKYVAKIEYFIISDALEANRGNISQTAKALGMQRTTLIERLKRLGLRN